VKFRICDLVASSSLISFIYAGMPRTAVFAAHGVHTTTGKHLVRAYQVAGATSSGSLPAWKLFEVSKLSSVAHLDEMAPALPADFNPADTNLNVHCHK
jgi:hypothetical protein